MSWNYRIVRDVHQVGDEKHEQFTIREVYYDDDGNINAWSAEPNYPSGDTWIDCANDHAIMGRAVGQPIVDISTGKAVLISPLRRR